MSSILEEIETQIAGLKNRDTKSTSASSAKSATASPRSKA